MADCACRVGTGSGKNNCLVKDSVGLLNISHQDCICNDRLQNMKASFFMGRKRGELCRCFDSDSVVSLDVHALNVRCVKAAKCTEHVEFSKMCEENEEHCRKKRCTDRYDSSESSDSGVAALSSSSTSDITDPGSPFSTASTHSSNSESGDEKSYPSTPIKSRASHPHGQSTPRRATPPPFPETERNFISLGYAESCATQSASQPASSVVQTRSAHWHAKPTVCARSSNSSASPDKTNKCPSVLSHVYPGSAHGYSLDPKSILLSVNSQHPPRVLTTRSTSAAEIPVASATTTIALNIPTYCVLSTNPQQTPTPKLTSYLLTGGNGLISPRKCILVATTTTNGTTSAEPSDSDVVNNPVQVHFLPTNTEMCQPLPPLDTLDPLSPTISPTLVTTSPGNKATSKKVVKSPTVRRLKPDSAQAKSAPSVTNKIITNSYINRNICVTRQQTQRCCVNMHKLPVHSHNTRKCVVGLKQQGKITEYFKHMKPLGSVKKDLSKEFQCTAASTTKKTMMSDSLNEEPDKLEKYFSLMSSVPSKIAKKVHTTSNKNVSITSPVQIFLLNKLESDSRVKKLLHNSYKPQNGLVTSPRRLQTPSLPSTKPLFLTPTNQKPTKKSAPLSPKKGTSPSPPIPPCTSSSPGVNPGVTPINLLLKICSGSESNLKTIVLPSSLDQQCEENRNGLECSNVTSGDSESGVSSLSAPILSAPKTIRFPAIHGSRHDNADDKTACRWAECSDSFDSSTGLMEHLQTKHVLPQASLEHYVCLWVGCKVYSRTSCSQSWLERHVLSHGGNKPFRCIVDGCGQRFGSNTALERHVNGHFDQEAGGSNAQGQRKSLDGVAGKMMRRNGKKLRYRKQPWSARMFDYFDSGIMEGLQHRLMGMTQARTSGIEATPGNTVVLTSKVVARRVAPNGQTRYLLRWFPQDVLEDEWVPQAQVVSTRTVPISSLSPSSSAPLHSALYTVSTNNPPRSKHRRKPGHSNHVT